MNMQAAVRHVFQNYATFSGRARRSEYWWWVLFTVIVGLIVGVIDGALFPYGMGMGTRGGMEGGGPLSTIWSLAILIPGIAVAVRRLHDTDHSGWWLLIVFIPLIGWVVLIFWFATLGTLGANRFGPDPLTDLAAKSY